MSIVILPCHPMHASKDSYYNVALISNSKSCNVFLFFIWRKRLCFAHFNVIIYHNVIRVPNIKFNVAKVLQAVIPVLDNSVSKEALLQSEQT